jgi:hypothetical protein
MQCHFSTFRRSTPVKPAGCGTFNPASLGVLIFGQFSQIGPALAVGSAPFPAPSGREVLTFKKALHPRCE